MKHKGLGIRKIVMETLRNAGMEEALMKETDETFKVTIYYSSNEKNNPSKP